MPIRAYAAAVGHNNTSDLAMLRPQPRNAADIQYPELVTAADGTVFPVGDPFVVLIFSVIEYVDYLNILEQLGLASETTFSRAVTVRLRDDLGVFRSYNGIASKQTGKQRGTGWWQNVTITISRLERI